MGGLAVPTVVRDSSTLPRRTRNDRCKAQAASRSGKFMNKQRRVRSCAWANAATGNEHERRRRAAWRCWCSNPQFASFAIAKLQVYDTDRHVRFAATSCTPSRHLEQ